MQVGPQQHQRQNILRHVRQGLQLVCLLIPGKAEMTGLDIRMAKAVDFYFGLVLKFASSCELS